MKINEDIDIACKLALDALSEGKIGKAKYILTDLKRRYGVATAATDAKVLKGLVNNERLKYGGGGK